MKNYVLIGQTPVEESDILVWAEWFGSADRIVRQTEILGASVSTVFLGLDHQWGDGPPLLFETMVFWPGEGGYEQERCSTWLEAQRQHAAMCTEAARPAAVLGYIRRCASDWWSKAMDDLRERWRQL